MVVVLEAHLGQIKLAVALDVNLLGAVDQDVADRVVAHQRLQWAQAQDFILDLFDEPQAVGIGHQTALFAQSIGDRAAEPARDRGRVE